MHPSSRRPRVPLAGAHPRWPAGLFSPHSSTYPLLGGVALSMHRRTEKKGP